MKDKSCAKCSHYGCLINQGMWWCNNGHTDNMDAENCEDYDNVQDSAILTTNSATTITTDTAAYQGIQQPNPMAKHKI